MMADANRARQEEEEIDFSDDDMGPGLGFETVEEIQRIELDAAAGDNGDNGPAAAGGNEPAAVPPCRRRKLKEALTSDVWKHFKRGPTQRDGSYLATCNYCGKEYPMGKQRSTSSLKHHILKGCKLIPKSKRHKPDALQRLLAAGTNSGLAPDPAVWVFDQLRSRNNLAKVVITHDYPFNCANHHYLKSFLSDLQPQFKMVSRNTIRNDCMNIYREGQLALYELFGRMNCRFSFTSDLWTCKGKDRGFMSLTCHFIDDSWNLKKRVISFVALSSPHTGKNIAEAIHERLVLWNLDKKGCSLVLDNSTANDACINELLNTTSIKNDLPVNGEIFHQRCACHILNLIVQDGLAVMGDEIKNVRETMKYIRHSQGRMEKFRLAATQASAPKKKPAWDVPTRWNSTFLMLELALELKEAIKRFATLDKKYTLNPSEEEWERVKALVECLKPFYAATLKLSGTRYPTLNLFFTEFCEVYLSIKKMGESEYLFVADMGKEMFRKWEKYWTSGNTLLCLACVFDPRCKLDVVKYYIEQMYPEEAGGFIESLKTCLHALYNEYAQAHLSLVQNHASSSAQPPPRTDAAAPVSDTRSGLKEFINSRKSSEPIKSDLDEFLSDALDGANVDDEFDILGWWKMKAPRYPVLAKLVRDILAVPISTVASESTFSTSGRTLSPIRSSLSDETVEALICAQDWLRADVIENGGELGDPLLPTDEATPDDGVVAS